MFIVILSLLAIVGIVVIYDKIKAKGVDGAWKDAKDRAIKVADDIDKKLQL